MTDHSFLTAQNQPVHSCCDSDIHEMPTITANEKSAIQNQTGNLLIAFGTIFANTPAFSEHIDDHTANMLVSIGKKLKRSK